MPMYFNFSIQIVRKTIIITNPLNANINPKKKKKVIVTVYQYYKYMDRVVSNFIKDS